MDFQDLKDQTILVAGAGGFIGGHLVADLIARGARNVRAADIKGLQAWEQISQNAENIICDLSLKAECEDAVDGCDVVFNLASDMGGMGFIENHRAQCMLSVLINTHLLQASAEMGVERYFFASSACVYAADKQSTTDNPGLRESDVYPAMPEDGYGWEKLFSERMCRHFQEDFLLQTRVARFHNVYGPKGTWRGGREKAPAAICRKVIEAQMTESQAIEIWGDGEQTRSFMYIADCLRGIYDITLSEDDSLPPINLGSSEMVSINQLVSTIESIAGVTLNRSYDLSAPKGVRGRSSDNELFREQFGWEPSIALRDGLEKTYAWIEEEMKSPQKRGPVHTAPATHEKGHSAAVQKLKEDLPMFDPLPGMPKLRDAGGSLFTRDDDDDNFLPS